MIKYMEIKTDNPIYTQKTRAKELVCSASTFERYSNDIFKVSPYNNKIDIIITRIPNHLYRARLI